MSSTFVEQVVRQVMSWSFAKDFAFTPRVRTGPGKVEFADVYVRLPEIPPSRRSVGILIQAKERMSDRPIDRWFKDRTEEARRQHRQSHRLLDNHPNVELRNMRGDIYKLEELRADTYHHVIVCGAEKQLLVLPKRYQEEDDCFFHIIEAKNLEAVLGSCTTPRVFLDFLLFRERWVLDHANENPSEKALFGYFLDPETEEPEETVDGLEQDNAVVDIRDFLDYASEHVELPAAEKRMFRQRLVGEAVWLDRAYWRSFRTHFDRCRNSSIDEAVDPYICGDDLNPERGIPPDASLFLFGILPVKSFTSADRATVKRWARAAAGKYGVHRVITIFFGRPKDGPPPILISS